MLDNVKSLHGDTPEDELSPEQLYERLQGAKLVAANLQNQIDSAKIVHSAMVEESARRARTINSMREICLDIAQDLARCGGYDHKSKNEVILAVISRLFAVNSNYAPRSQPRDMDDIPF